MITSFTTEQQHNELFFPFISNVTLFTCKDNQIILLTFYSMFPSRSAMSVNPSPKPACPHPWDIRLRLLEIIHAAARWYWFCYSPFLFICPLVYETFMEGTVSFHISMVCSGMLWIQESSELPVSPGWTAWRLLTVTYWCAPHPTSCLQWAKGQRDFGGCQSEPFLVICSRTSNMKMSMEMKNQTCPPKHTCRDVLNC